MRGLYLPATIAAMVLVAGADVRAEESAADEPIAVTGIGGVFIRAQDPVAMTAWYEENLGIPRTPATYEEDPWQQEAGPTVFGMFAQNTEYFGRAEQQFMLNFRTDDLDALVAHLRENGNEVTVDAETYPNGRFARVHDPEGNPIQLWEPADPNVEEAAHHPEARPFDADVNAGGALDAAFERAAENGNRVLLVLGGNWCHDSRGLAGWFETPRFAEMLSESYEVVYVNIGLPQTGDGFNLDIPQRYGIEEITGTPTVLVLSSEGELLNPISATTWNDAASRSEDEIFEYFAAFEPEG